ncbi:MAG: SurA N-terminal domain-containing protein [Ignavibacteria bacterium]|nr:SurA N-terminal domain-containing protein [Ignavibacteria bacterium]
MVLILFFLGALFGSTASAQVLAPSQPSQQQRLFAGTINADTVWLDEYSREVGRLTEMATQRGEVDPSDIMEQAWNDVIRRRILLQEAARRGLQLELREVDSILLEATPDFIRRGIVDEKGRFDKGLLTAMLYAPDSLIRINTPGMSTDQRANERAQLNASIAQLRERVGLMEMEKRLRAIVAKDHRFDTTGLRQRYRDVATSATVDVILIPCVKDLPSPNLADLKAYHKAHPTAFTSPLPMRRLAFISWPMAAAPIDSSLFLGNVNDFVGLLNKATSKRQRDSIWASVATTTSSGATRLSPDSASHRMFYASVKGKKPGTAVGPIKHSTGIHVLLVDTVHAKSAKIAGEISIRVIISEIEPSRQTIDSILRQVDEAAEMYERGMELSAIAGRFGRVPESSPWFTEEEKIYGSHRLVDVAFKTPVSVACDPIDTPERGAVLAIVVDSVPAGPMPFEAAVPRIAEALNRERGCEERRQLANTVKGLTSRLDDGLMFIGETPKEAQIARGLNVHSDGMIGEVLYDPTAAKEILAKPTPDLFGPFLAESGWYIVNISGVIKANDDEYPMWLEMRKETIEAEQIEAHWQSFVKGLRTNAIIEDNRWVYFRY